MSDAAGDAQAAKSKRAYQSGWAWLRFLLPAAAGLAGDLWLKSWSFPDGVPLAALGDNPAPVGIHPAKFGDMVPVMPKVLGFTTIVNQGAVFGIGQGKVELFLAFSVVALAIIVWVFATSGAKHRVVHVALGLITAGALGNLYDRAVFHGVRDMLKFLCFVWAGKDRYPFIFNLADVLLCVGVPLLILRWLIVRDDDAKESKPATGLEPGIKT